MGKRAESGSLKILAWNVSGIKNKLSNFWEYIKKFEIVVLIETWVEGKEWKGWEKKLPKEYDWGRLDAQRIHVKGRAAGGILVGIRKELDMEKQAKFVASAQTIRWSGRIEDQQWNLLAVYNREGWEKLAPEIRDQMGREEEKENEVWVVVEDMNARIAEQGIVIGGDGRERKRRSKDKDCNTEGRKMKKWLQEENMFVLNGWAQGDENGEWTYVEKRMGSVLDYGIVNEWTREKVVKFEIEDRVESDHMPLKILLKTHERVIKEKKGAVGTSDRKRYEWSEEGRAAYQLKLEDEKWKGIEGGTVEQRWERIKEKIERARLRKERVWGRKRKNYAPWWGIRCNEGRRLVRRRLKEMRNAKEGERELCREEYIRARRNWKKICEESRKQWRKEIAGEVANLKNEEEFWKFINKERRNKKGVRNNIGEQEWVEHFKEQLGGQIQRTEWEDVWTEEETRAEEGIWSEDITEEEVEREIRKLSVKKAAGGDSLENEVWKYATETIKRELLQLCNEVWKSGVMPEGWREATVVPIYKSRDANSAKNYRGISLLSTAYKIFASVINVRLTRWAEEAKILPENQAGFRCGRGTRDNIYILQTIVENRLRKKRGKLYAFYVDLRAAFETIDREEMCKKLKILGVKGRLGRSIEMIYKRTTNRVRTEEGMSKVFGSWQGVRQGCPLSPVLFNLYIADLEKWLEKNQDGGTIIKGKKIFTLAYADDMILMAENPEEMKGMLRCLEKYLKRYKLELNVKKSKMQIFKKGGKPAKAEKWLWKQQEIEIVKTYKYLGYMMQADGGCAEQVKYVKQKARAAMGAVWGLGERWLKGELKLRMKLFKVIIEAIVLYGVEIWGVQEQEELQRLETTYWRWMLGLDWNTPQYLIQEEMGIEMLWGSTWWRAHMYERRMVEQEKETWAKACAVWRREGAQSELKGKQKEKEELAKIGLSIEGQRDMEDRGWDMKLEIQRRIMERKWHTNECRIEGSRYNPEYRKWKSGREKCAYIVDRRINLKEKRLLARYRLGNEAEGGKY